VKKFRELHPQFDHIAVVPVNTPDYTGSLESGFAAAVEAIVDCMVPETNHVGRRRRQVNVLANSSLSPGDIEAIKDWVEAFGLRPVVLPDIGDSLDGHLMDGQFSALTVGGTPKAEIEAMGESIATLVIGRSLDRAADALKRRTAVPDFASTPDGPRCLRQFTQTLAHFRQPVPGKSNATAPSCRTRWSIPTSRPASRASRWRWTRTT
jgi:nitrogenase molybdenum-iron protein NifN